MSLVNEARRILENQSMIYKSNECAYLRGWKIVPAVRALWRGGYAMIKLMMQTRDDQWHEEPGSSPI
jgi:hypothetical protein